MQLTKRNREIVDIRIRPPRCATRAQSECGIRIAPAGTTEAQTQVGI